MSSHQENDYQALRDELARVVQGAPLVGAVRPEILPSWRESVAAGLWAEHFMDALSTMTTVGASIFDLRTGRVLGGVALVCPVASTNALLLPVARRAAHEIEHELLDGGSTRERLLDEHFLRVRRRSRAP